MGLTLSESDVAVSSSTGLHVVAGTTEINCSRDYVCDFNSEFDVRTPLVKSSCNLTDVIKTKFWELLNTWILPLVDDGVIITSMKMSVFKSPKVDDLDLCVLVLINSCMYIEVGITEENKLLES